MSTQYKLIMRQDSVEQNLYHIKIVPEDYVENADEKIFAGGLSEDEVNYFDKLSRKQRQSLIEDVISSMVAIIKFKEHVKKMNISEIQEHLFELENYIKTFDVEATLKKRNKHKLIHQLEIKCSEIHCINEEMGIRLDKIKGEHELILT